MADRKLFDLSIGIMVGVFVLSILVYVVADMDSSVNDFSISSEVRSSYAQVNSSDINSRESLDNSIFNGTPYNLGANQFIDTRMQGQGTNYAKDSKGLIKDFFNNVNLTKWDYHGLIAKFIVAMFVLIVGILTARMILGYTRI